MKIVIDIDNETYGRIQALVNADYFEHDICGYSMQRIANGTPYEEKSTGHWKDHRWCSNCGCGIPTDVYGTSITEEEAHFCVECGTDMRREYCDD